MKKTTKKKVVKKKRTKTPTIDVCGVKYKIKVVPPNGAYYGMCMNDKKVIEIVEGLNKEQFYITYLHEVMHAIIFESSLHQALCREIVEVICEQTAKVLYPLIESKESK